MSQRRPPVVDRQRLQALQARARRAVDELRARPTSTAPSVTVPTVTLPTVTLPTPPTVTLPQVPELPPLDPRVLALQQRRRRQRIVAGLVVLALLLLALLLRDCNACAPEVKVVYVEADAPTCPDVPECGPAKPKPKPKPAVKPKPKAKPTGVARADERDDLVVTTRATPDWLAALRLQVTARSLDLARCFNGVEKPGALRWTTTMVPASGIASDSSLEHVLRSVPLTTAQQACVLAVLTQRPFRLDSRDAIGTRVSLIIEF